MGLTDEATPVNLAARRALLIELRGLANVMETMRLSTVALADRLPSPGEQA
jgi:glycerol-3-phosphate O-acyltransferase